MKNKIFNKWWSIASLLVACNVHDPQNNVPSMSVEQAERNTDRILTTYCNNYSREGSKIKCSRYECESAMYPVYFPSTRCKEKSMDHWCIDADEVHYLCQVAKYSEISLDLAESKEVQLFPQEVYFHVKVDNYPKSPTATFVHHNLSEARALTDSLYVMMQEYRRQKVEVDSNEREK